MPRQHASTRPTTARPTPAAVDGLTAAAAYPAPLATTAPLALQRAAVRQLQPVIGNAQIARQLLQRDPTPAAAGSASTTPAPSADPPQPSNDVYKLVKDALGEKQVADAARDLAKRAAEIVMDQVKGAATETDFVQKAQAKLTGELLSTYLQGQASTIAKSPEVAKIRNAITQLAKDSPEAIIAAVVAAAAIAGLANVDIPEISKTFELTKKLKVDGGLDLGHFQQLSVNQIKLGITYGGDQAKKASGGSGGATAPEVNVNGDAKFLNGKLHLDLGTKLTLQQLGLSGGASFDSVDGWKGNAAVQVGGKDTHLTSKLTFEKDGKLGFEFGGELKQQLGRATLGGGAGIKAEGNNGDFSITGVNIRAMLRVPLVGDPKQPGKSLIMLNFDASFQQNTPDPTKSTPPSLLQGTVVLEGHF